MLMMLLMTFRILIESTKIAFELKNNYEIITWRNAIYRNKNSQTLHLKCAIYMDVIEADEASDDLQDFYRNDKNCIRIEKHFWNFYAIESCWCKENSHILHLKCVSYMDVIEDDDVSDDLQDFNRDNKNSIWIEKHSWNYYMKECYWSKQKLAYTAFEMCQLHGCDRGWWSFWWPSGS